MSSKEMLWRDTLAWVSSPDLHSVNRFKTTVSDLSTWHSAAMNPHQNVVERITPPSLEAR